MVHLINPRANHQAHSNHPWKVWLKTRVPGSLERIHAHVSPGAVSGDTELSCCSEGTARSSTALPGCRALPGASTSQIPHKVSHSQGIKTCFLSRHCNLCSGKAAWRPFKPHEHHVKVRQSPGSSCPTAPMGSTGDCSLLFWWPSEGCSAHLLFGLWSAGGSHQSILASHQCGKWPMAWPGLSLQHSWPWDEQDARGAMSATGRLCHASLGEHGSCKKSIIQRACLGWCSAEDENKLRAVALVATGAAGWEHSPCHFAFSQHTAWSGRTDQEPSLH